MREVELAEADDEQKTSFVAVRRLVASVNHLRLNPSPPRSQRASQNFRDEKMLRKVSVKQGLIPSFSHDFLVQKGQPFLDLFSTFSCRQKSLTSPVMKGVRE